MPRGRPSNSDLPQSATPGVVWDKQTGKWRGVLNNQLKRTASGGYKTECTAYFVDEADCIKATKALRKKINDEYEAHGTRLAEADPLTKGLPRGPDNAADAEPKKLYWRPNPHIEHKPHRAVRGSAGKSGFGWPRACQHGRCTSLAVQAIKGGPAEFCTAHGGVCPHGRAWQVCPECGYGTKSLKKCSNCPTIISHKRKESKGGNGLCPRCEEHLRNEAAENGSEPPAKGKRWEDVVLDELVTLVVDTEGNVICHESRDDMSNMLGSNKRRRAGECSTNHQRRPDLLYLVRDKEARIVAALFVEVDENSHGDRDPACEAGKIDETFQAILQLAQKEGAARGAAARAWVRTPYCLFLKMNPNACDAPGGAIKLSTRIKDLAERCNNFLNMPPSFFHELSDAGMCMQPHVECLYYHTKQGAKNLEYFKTHAAGALAWHGNVCERV
jgi:hypothetical protein